MRCGLLNSRQGRWRGSPRTAGFLRDRLDEDSPGASLRDRRGRSGLQRCAAIAWCACKRAASIPVSIWRATLLLGRLSPAPMALFGSPLLAGTKLRAYATPLTAMFG